MMLQLSQVNEFLESCPQVFVIQEILECHLHNVPDIDWVNPLQQLLIRPRHRIAVYQLIHTSVYTLKY